MIKASEITPILRRFTGKIFSCLFACCQRGFASKRKFIFIALGIIVILMLLFVRRSETGIAKEPQIVFQEARQWQIAADAPDTLTIRPNAVGDVTTLGTLVGAATHWEAVDEDPSDDDTSYVANLAKNATQYDLYNLADHTAEQGIINNITVYIHVKEFSAKAATAATVIKTGGTEDRGTANTLTPEATSYTTYSTVYTEKPAGAGGGAWSWSDIDSLQAGVELAEGAADNNADLRCTQAWVVVDYIPEITVSGTVYTNEGVSGMGSGRTVTVVVNGTNSYSTTTKADNSGDYWIGSIPAPSVNDVFTVFLNGAAEKAATITKASSTDPIVNLNLYQNRVIVRDQGSPASPITIEDMAYYDFNDDLDIQFTATTTNGTATTTTIFSGNKLYIWPQKTFNASGTITILANADSEPSGSLHIADGATLVACPLADCPAGGDISVGGSWIASSSATFTHNNATTTFTATSTGKNIWTEGSSDFYNVVFNGSGGEWTFKSISATTTNDFTITQGTVTSTSEILYVGGSWLVGSSGTFLHNNSTTTFNSADTGETINPGSSSFYNVDFDNAGGGWTITNDATSTNNWFLTNAAASNGFIVDSGKRIEVKGQFSNQLPGTETSWNSGSLLYLNSGTAYTVNSKTVGDIYEALQIGVNTDIRMWNSSSSINSYTIDVSSSLYSQDHGGDNGYLYIFGNYNVSDGSTDYWSYATDFDGTDISGGSERQCHVRLAANSTTTVLSGKTLQALGGSANTSTTINRQGGSGNYAIRTMEGATINFQYYQVRNIDFSGLNLTASSTVSSLNYGDFLLELEGATMITVSSSTIDQNAGLTITGAEFSSSTGAAATLGYNVTETGTAISYWLFSSSIGNYDGEAYDSDPGGDPGYIRWDDSATTTLTQWYYRWYDNANQINPVNPLAATNTQATNATSGTVFRLRINIQIGSVQLDAGNRNFILQYASATDCSAVSESNWTEIGGLAADYTSVWRGYNNSTPDDGDTITSLLLVGKSDVLESYEETSPSVNNPNAIPAGQAGEWDWALQYNAAYSSRTYCFRMAKASGNPFDAYTNYPKIVTYAAATWKAAEDTSTSAATGTDIRLRFQLINTGDATATDYKYQIEYASRSGGTCGDETFIPMPILNTSTTALFEMTTSSFFRYQDPTTHQLSGTSTYPFNTGQLVETYATTGDMDVGDVSLSETEYVFNISTTTPSDYYCFRLTNNGTALDNYNVYGVLYVGIVGIDLSGTIYPNEGGTPYGCDGTSLTVTAKVNGAGSYEGTCTESNGNYTISTITASAGDVITVFLNGEAEKAVAVTKAIDGNTNISGLDLYENRVILRSDNGVALTVENMAQYDNSDDPDIQFTATTTNGTATTTSILSGNKLYIWTNDSFSPGGEVKILANADSEPSGSLHIGTGATFTACSPSTCTAGSDISVSGSWIASSTATFTHNNATTTFKATSTGKNIWIKGSSDFYNIKFNGSGGNWTFQDHATSTATTTVTAGTLIQGTSIDLTLGGLYIETGTGIFTKDAGTGVLYFERTADGDPSVIDDVQADNNLGDVYIGYSPGVTNQNSDIIVDSLTVNLGDTHNTRGYEIDCGSSITIYGTLNATDDKEGDLTNIFLQTNWTNTGTFTHGNSTTTFDGTTENNTIAPGGSDFYSIVFDGSGGGWEFTSNSATATHDFFILQGTATSSSEMLYVGGSWYVGASGTFLHNNATTTFDSVDTGETINPGSSSYYNVDFDNAGGGWTITNDATSTNNWFLTNAAAASGFIVNSNVRIEVKGQYYTELPGTETTWNSGSLLYLNSNTNYLANPKTVGDIYETLQIGVNTDVRMWNSTSSTYTVDSSGSLYSMDHDRDGNGAGDDGYLYIWGDYHIPAGETDYWCYDTDFDGTAGVSRQANVRFAANSTTTFDAGETLHATGTDANTSTTIDVQESGTYAIKVDGGTLNMYYYQIRNINENGLWLTGSPTITDLSYGDYGYNIEGGTMIKVASAVIDANNLKTFTGCEFSTTSDLNTVYNVTEVGTPSSYWTFSSHTGNLDGEDYDNDPGDVPGYIRWDDSGVVVSGIIYTNEGVTAFNCVGDNLTVKIELNGAGDYIDVCDTGDGSYSMTVPIGAVNDVLTAFIDGHGSFRAVTITKASSSDDAISGLDLYQNRVIVRHEDSPASSITIADMSYYDANDDSDIKFTATTTDGTATTTTIFSGNKLYIWPYKTFNTSGSIAILGNGGGEPDGSLHIADGATLTACPAADCTAGNEITLAGSWIASSSATFIHNNGTTTFTATTTGKNIWTEGSSDFYNIEFNGSGGGWKFETNSATTTNDFTITQGTVTSTSGILYVGGDWDNSGTFNHNSGTVLFNATDGHTIADGNSPFYLLTFNGSGGAWLYQDGASVSPATTTVQNGTSTFLNAKAGGVKVTGGYLLVDWYLGAHLIDASNTDTNIDTDDCDDITISEGSSSSTIWGYIEGTGWDGPYNSTTTGTGLACGGDSGINPQPGSTTAIRIREYKKTATETFYYKYNLKVEWQTNYGEYDYYDDYGGNYLTSASSTVSSGVDKVITQTWYRTSSSTINSPYTCSAGSGSQCINQPPDNGSWYVGMRPGLLFEITTGLNVDFGELDSTNNWTAKASSTLEVTTSASNGYVVTAWAINEARMKLGSFDIYISKYDSKNDAPKEWNQNCTQNSNCCGFGFTTDDSSLSGGTANRFTSGSATCSGAGASSIEAYSGFATSTETVALNMVADLSNPTTTDRTIITYKVSVDSAQAAGNYQTTVIYICTANY